MPDKPFHRSKLSDARGDTPAGRALAIMRRNLRLILVCVLLVPAAALAYSLAQESQYEATASLLFRDPGIDDALFGDAVFSEEGDSSRTAATNLKLVSLREISDRTARALPALELSGESVSEKVSVSPDGASDLITVTAQDGDPSTAAALANTFAEEYIAFRREADRAKIGEAQELVQAEIESLDPVEQASDAERLRQQARELEILASLQTGNAELVQVAHPPSEAASPKPSRNLALGIVLGLVLAAGLTVLREQLDRRFKDVEEVTATFDLPILATIPDSRDLARSRQGHEGQSGATEHESFRMLRANLRYFNVSRDIESILVTSADSQDGKTTVAWNLALAEARAGERVLYLEADLRRPTIAARIGAEATEVGLSLVLAGSLARLEDAIQQYHGVDVVIAGPLPPNPAELVESERMRQLIAWGKRNYDRVVVDTPPAGIVADSVPLMRDVDGVITVVRVQHSRRDDAEALHEQLTNIGAPLLGIVLNGIPTRNDREYYGSPASERFAASQARGSRDPSVGSDEATAKQRSAEPRATRRTAGRSASRD